MSQALISASEKSITLSKLVSMNKTVPFYQPSPATDALGVLYTKVYPSIPLTGAIADQSVTWTMPSAGFMLDASFGFTCRVASVAGLDVTQPISLNMVRTFEIISNGVPVISKSGIGLKCQVNTLRDISHQAFILRHSTFLNATNEIPTVPANANTDWITYLPCIETFLSASEKALLLNKCKLEVRITFNSNAMSGVQGNITFTAAPVMYLKTYMPKLSLYNEIVTQDWSKQFSMDAINCYVEAVPITSSYTSVSGYQITCPYLAIKTHFIVQRVSTAALAAGGGAVSGAPTRKINSISLNIGGVKFLDDYKTSRVISNECKYGMSKFGLADANGAVTYSNDILTIDWGLTGSRSGAYGCNFWAENQGSTVDVTFENVGADPADRALFQLYVVNEYVQLADWVPGSGGRGFLQVTSNN